MPAHLEFIVSILEIVAFILVTPAVLGEEKLEAIYQRVARAFGWFNQHWFSRSVVSPSQAATMALMVVLFALASVGWITDTRWIIAPITITTIVPAIVIWVMRRVHHMPAAPRTMALIGAALFFIGRGIVILSAWGRL